MAEAPAKKDIDRRTFMSRSILLISGAITVVMGIPSVLYVVGQSLLKKLEQQWVSLGSITKIETGVPTLFKANITRQDGWITTQEELSVYVITEDRRNYLALSNTCTHLGCKVRWIAEDSKFFCPCHNGVFDKTGAVLEGPPPRPLDQYELKIEDDNIFIKVA